MLIVHTSDWHAGRIWKGINRLDELGAVLEHLGDFLERERVDLLLHTGDVFDTGAPPADAERLVFRFFKRVGGAGIPSVVIAGNHDSPARVEAWGALAELAGVHAVARPRRAALGGCLTIVTRGGETARVAAVPFAAPRVFVSALELAADDTLSRQRYADGLKAMVAEVCSGFEARAVNLLLLHTHLAGAVYSGSERRVHLGEEWAATPQALPASAHYIALGHIHKPQPIDTAAPAYYAGSALQLDFGETGENKSFVVVRAEAGTPARVERELYEGARPLLRVRCTLAEIERQAPTLAAAGWLHVSVPLAQRDLDLAAKVRQLLPNALRIEAELPPRAEDDSPTAAAPRGAPPAELYRAYHQREHGGAPAAAVVEAFEQMYHDEEQGA